ncbi:MAG: family 43 glycosylhydrolase [Candidatus Pseudobacter hemicellulosilyticus]|uniref:Family 43 glycosylhydrolase n=1 Tax=Candidatus Pseudobacter hemicellulosilyticus TaxID=3121375 RepID=A0AAJ5WKL2_9BACT|nr:MAG: family 43 glycosylhydrolase [Pseudobacter sp.]
MKNVQQAGIHSLIRLFVFIICWLFLLPAAIAQPAREAGPALREPYTAYLFTYFTGNRQEQEQVYFALSEDGLNWRSLNGNRPVLDGAAISSAGGVRDPHILRGADGKTFYMVVTDMVSGKGWNSNRAMVLLRSGDLLNWTSAVVNIQQRFPGNDSLLRVWAPQTHYDAQAKKYMVYFSMKHGNEPDKIYYAYANADFTDLETVPQQLFFPPDGGACIDGDIIEKDGRFHLFFKTEGNGAGIKVAVSDQLTGGYTLRDRFVQQTADAVEGAGVFPLNNGEGYILMYDVYMKGQYQFTKTRDLEHFSLLTEKLSMDFHPRHGTVLPITAREAQALKEKWSTTQHNPVLKGYYADPAIIYSKANKKFYLYPTSDGFNDWSGTYFKAFSSPDLVQWTDEGIILDLPKDVPWGPRNAWAPTMLEKKIGRKKYRYYFYFTAAQQIGVAVADKPTGPFKDLGKPLINALPPAVKGGQQIDPDVFTDPVSGKHFLYWGNGYMAGAELNADGVSLAPGTTTVLTPDQTFREGTCVFYRKGKYYFLWSEDDTRSENYRVRYGTATAPLGAITVPAENLVLAKDVPAGIYGTGHNSVIQVPGTDNWYIVYHRFHYPDGITMGRAAGFHREVCMDKLEFNADGSIRQVKPTHSGISPVTIK